MGVLIRVKNASFAGRAVAFVPPVADGLEYWNFFGGDASQSRRNLAPGKNGASLVGALTYNAHSAIFKGGTNFLITEVADPESVTFIAVARCPTEEAGMIISNYRSPRIGGVGTTLGKSLLLNPGNPDGALDASMFSSRWDGAGGASSAAGATRVQAVPTNSWGAFVGRSNESTKIRDVVNKTNNLAATNPITALGDISAAPFRIGSPHVDNEYNQSSEIAAAIIFSRALSNDEVEKVYGFLKGYFARRGIAI